MSDNEKELTNLLNEGISAYYKENFAESEKILLKAKEIDPENDEVNYQLGSACFYQHRVEESLEYYKKAVLLEPDDPHYRFVLGFAYMKNNNIKEAAAEFEESVKLDDSEVQAHKNLGEARYLLGDYLKSADAFMRAAEMDPKAENYIYHYISLRKSGSEEAVEILRKSGKSVPRDDSLFMIMRLFLGFIDTNLLPGKIGERVMSSSVYYHCGMRELFDGRPDAARDFFRKSVESRQEFIPEYRRAQHELETFDK